MDNNEMYAAMILHGLTFEALRVTNFIEISVYEKNYALHKPCWLKNL